MEYNNSRNITKTLGLVIFAVGLAFLTYKIYVNRFFFFDLPMPNSFLSDYYTAQYMKEFLNENPGNTLEFYLRVLGFWQPAVPIAIGLVMAVIGKKNSR